MANSLQMTYVMLRLNRWGVYVRWLNSRGVSDPSPRPVVSCMGKLMEGRVQQTGDTSRAYETLCPVDIDEATDTQRCVVALPPWARQTAVEDYLVGGTQEQKARALCISERAFRYRRDLVHTYLLELFNLAAADLPLELMANQGGRPPIVA